MKPYNPLRVTHNSTKSPLICFASKTGIQTPNAWSKSKTCSPRNQYVQTLNTLNTIKQNNQKQIIFRYPQKKSNRNNKRSDNTCVSRPFCHNRFRQPSQITKNKKTKQRFYFCSEKTRMWRGREKVERGMKKSEEICAIRRLRIEIRFS